MTRRWATCIVWAVALAGLLSAGVLASLFALMATSLDPVEAIKAGLEPWVDALYAAVAFLGVLATTTVALVAWHSRRFRPVGAILTVAQAFIVAWAGWQVYADYF